MLPDLQSSLICDDVRQERNGKFILIGLFDVLSVPGIPAILSRLCIVNRWCCGKGSCSQKSRILKADGNTVLIEGKDVHVHLDDNEAVATSVEYFMNVKLEEEGTYWIEILLEKDLKLRYPFKVNIMEQPQK